MIFQPHCRLEVVFFFCTVWGKLFLTGSSYIFISFVRLINATASSLGCLKYLEERKRFVHIFAAELDLVELLLDFWVKIPSWYKSVRFHWYILDDQFCGRSGLPQLNLVTEPELLCTEHMTVAAVFLCGECGIHFCCLLSLCIKKDRCVCTFMHTQTCMDVYTHSHPHTENCAGKPPPSFHLPSHWTHTPSTLTNMEPHWRFGSQCPNLFPRTKKFQNVPKNSKTPPSINTHLGDT